MILVVKDQVDLQDLKENKEQKMNSIKLVG